MIQTRNRIIRLVFHILFLLVEIRVVLMSHTPIIIITIETAVERPSILINIVDIAQIWIKVTIGICIGISIVFN